MLLSIVIPTHNRARYARGCIDSLVGLAKSSDVEIIISDSSLDSELNDYVKKFYNKLNVKVYRPKNVNNAVDNFNYSIAKARGDYILMLGDDDTVLINIVDILHKLKAKKIDAARFNFPYEYFWDDCYEYESYLNSSLSVQEFSNTVVGFDAILAAEEAGENLGHGVSNMPRAYLGVISRELLSRINSKYGNLFGGVSPDIYSSLLISSEAKSAVLIDVPVVVPGSSGASTSGKSVNGKHVSELLDNDHLSAFPDLRWDARIPEFYSTHTVWAYSYLQAFNAIQDLTKTRRSEPNFYRLIIKCLYNYPKYYKHTLYSLLELFRNEPGYSIFKLTFSVVEELIWVITRLYLRIFRPKPVRVLSILSLTSCVSYVSGKIGCDIEGD